MAQSGRWRRGRGATFLCWLLVAPAAGWALVRTFGWERGPLVQLLAFTPYAAAGSLLALALALLARRWWAAGVAGLVALALVVAVLPRALPSDVADRPGAGAGAVVRVLTANLYVGDIDPPALVSLVRDHQVDVLALQEFTPDAQRALDRAGLAGTLPHREAHPVVGTEGSAIYSRFPLRDGGFRVNTGGFWQAYATVTVPGAGPVRVESVHACAPYALSQLPCWWTDLADQPPATAADPPQILAGDFNATLDHVAMRRLIGTGYRDAAAAVGSGLSPTWGPYGDRPVPPVTLDHVLVDRRIGVLAAEVHPLPHSDHRAVLAELVLPPVGPRQPAA